MEAARVKNVSFLVTFTAEINIDDVMEEFSTNNLDEIYDTISENIYSYIDTSDLEVRDVEISDYDEVED